MQFTAALFTLATAATVFAATAADVADDVTAIDKATTALNNQIQATDGSNAITDLNIDSAAKKLVKALKSATTDVKSLTKNATSTQAKAIIKTLTGTEKTTKAACTKLSADKAGYESAGVTDVVAADVKSLSSAVSSFGKALLAKTPSSSTDTATALLKKFTADLKICTSSYPSS